MAHTCDDSCDCSCEHCLSQRGATSTTEPTVPGQVYRDAARKVAAVEDWRHDPGLTSLVEYPAFRAAVESAYRVGYEQCRVEQSLELLDYAATWPANHPARRWLQVAGAIVGPEQSLDEMAADLVAMTEAIRKRRDG